MRIAVVGAGMTGMSLAERLAAGGHRVTVLEKDTQIGGLATHHDFGSFVWDRYYHVILPTDTALCAYLGTIGLGEQLRWRRTLTGFYVDQRLHSLSSTRDFLTFAPLGPWSKLRLAFTILYCARVSDWRALEDVGVEPWLRRLSGDATYDKLWQPLLLARLGTSYREVSAVFIWSYIKRMYSARQSGARKEYLGHVHGGYRTVFERLRGLIEARGGMVRLSTEVDAIVPLPRGGLELDCKQRDSQRSPDATRFDKVIYTGPNSLLERLARPDLVSMDDRGGRVRYLGVVCPSLVTDRPLTPYYVTNIADGRIPFTGIIGMSSLVDTAQTNGRYLSYFPSYLPSDDPAFDKPDEEVREQTLRGISRMLPDFEPASVESVHVNRARYVQPLQVCGYSKLVSRVEPRHPDFYVLNTTQFLDSTLNNDAAMRATEAFLRETAADFRLPGTRT